MSHEAFSGTESVIRFLVAFRTGLALIGLALLLATPASFGSSDGTKIILIGGAWEQYDLGAHDFPHGIEFIAQALEQSSHPPNRLGLTVESYPHGWPPPEALDEAATLVFYFSGDGKHPLLDLSRRDAIEKLMERGIGLVALHQAFTLPEDGGGVPLLDWLGGVRLGKADRTTQPARLQVSSPSHPVASGVSGFVHYDEYFPTVHFDARGGRLIPILSADLPIHFERGIARADGDIGTHTIAWAYERQNGGRSFGYSGGHFLAGWDDKPARTLLLNAILWSAGEDMPLGGITTAVADDAATRLAFPGRELGRVSEPSLRRTGDYEVVLFPWGYIEWHVSGPLGNSDSLTTGIATLMPGESNPVHFHPNCDEVLHVMSGSILHRLGDRTVEMGPGDTVSIPRNVRHNATNTGTEEAKLAISFSTAWREVVGE